jgi:hypothetical protein
MQTQESTNGNGSENLPVVAEPKNDVIAGESGPLAVRNYQSTEEGVMATWNSASQLLATSLSVIGDELTAAISAGLGEASLKTIDLPGKMLEVVDFLAHPIQIVSEDTGEVGYRIRVVLFLANGARVSTCSEPCVKMLSYLTKVWGKGPWNPPKTMSFSRHPRRQGEAGHYYTVEQVVPAKIVSEPKK